VKCGGGEVRRREGEVATGRRGGCGGEARERRRVQGALVDFLARVEEDDVWD
jgi:hypothetical protein